MIKWLEKYAPALQALSAIGALVAVVGGIVGIRVQLNASAQMQREQSARDIYREFLNISISQPKFAAPDYCAIRATADEAAYENYVQYMLYTSEQVLTALPGWEPTMAEHLSDHEELLCSEADWSGDAPQVQGLINRFRAKECKAFKSSCS
jgi:hypothetical protein